MATDVQTDTCTKTAEPEAGEGVLYVARQPILDLHSKVHAYELLFSNGQGMKSRSDQDAAARRVVDDTVIFGLGKMTSGLPAFVKCTSEMMTETLVGMLPSSMTVLQITEDAESQSTLTAMCRTLKTAGYRLALDKFQWAPGIEPLLEAAAYVKIDFSAINRLERRELLSRLRHFPVALVAEKVETQEQFAQARDEGFSLVQGYYFCRPVLLEKHKIPVNRLSQVEILRALNDEKMNLHKLTELVKRNASLTYRLLRLINSPVCAMQQEIQSVQAALLAVGEETFRRMAMVAIASDLNSGQPLELFRMAFVRGRFCELAARSQNLDCSEQYLLGLLSLLPAMLRAPMIDLAPSLPLRAEIRQALMGDRVPERSLLTWLERYELGDWIACGEIAKEMNLTEWDLLRSYQEAVLWAEAALYFA
jgi:EAL and modified HD-GYP domain-containing signal transduction protein